ncbi:PucR family transcriptional regulator [Intrasporangium chromatireducens]|nr:helix-turn-helix domain-containing protein [Intrasporangium chromatireducens]
MPTLPAAMADQLRDVLRLAADAAGGAQVRLHMRSEQDVRFELAATSDDESPSCAAAPLAAGLRDRVLESESPIVVAEKATRRLFVMARVLGPSGDAIGFLTLDGGEASSEHGSDPDSSILRGIATVATLAATTIASVYRSHALTRANGNLRARATVDGRLTEIMRDGGGLTALVGEVARLTGKPTTLFDHGHRQITTASSGGTAPVWSPAIHAVLTDHDADAGDTTETFIVPAGGVGGLSRRKIVAPVVAAGEVFGWLVIDEHPSRFSALDTYAAHRTAAHLASELLVQRRVARMAWNAKSALARSLIRGTHTAEDLMASADYLGVDTGARRILAYVHEPSHARSNECVDQTLAGAIEHALGVEVLTTRGSDGVLLVIEAPADRPNVSLVHEVKAAIASATARLCGPDVIVGISSVCEPNALSRGYREAREVVHCIDRFVGRTANNVLAVDDLGPARLFLANSDTSAIKAYVGDVLGRLLSSEPGMADLLLTLQCYFDASRSVRASAARLGVHENTIRLRLARVAAATGLDVAGDANDQLSVQTALLVLRLQGHPTLDAIGTRVPADAGAAGTEPTEPASRHTGLAPGEASTGRKTA